MHILQPKPRYSCYCCINYKRCIVLMVEEYDDLEEDDEEDEDEDDDD